jgi:hypothetical protein
LQPGPDGTARPVCLESAGHELTAERQLADRFQRRHEPPTYTVTVFWDEVGSPVNPVQHQIVLQLPTF